MEKYIFYTVIIFLTICMANIQTASAQEIIGRGSYFVDNMSLPRGHWELNDDGIMYIWTDADVFKLRFCRQVDPPYEYTWERHIYNPGDPINSYWWSPRERGVGRMANDPRTVGSVEAELYAYCWWSGPKDLGQGWTPYGFESGRNLIYLVGGVDNGFSAFVPTDPGTYGGDPHGCGACADTNNSGWWMTTAPRVIGDISGRTDSEDGLSGPEEGKDIAGKTDGGTTTNTGDSSGGDGCPITFSRCEPPTDDPCYLGDGNECYNKILKLMGSNVSL